MKLNLSALLGWKKMIFPFVGILAVLFAVYLGYRHHVGVVKENGTLKGRVATLETALDTEQAAVRELLKALEAWQLAQGRMSTLVEGMQDDSNVALEDTRQLQRLFTSIDWDSVAPDSVANAISNRLWQRLSTASDSGLYRGTATDTTANSAAKTR